jgi:hypothetical protein
VEEVRRAAVAALAVVFISIRCFCSVIDPPALNLKQVCGTASVSSAQLMLKANGTGSDIVIHADREGKFDFVNLPAGKYRLSMTWLDEKGNVQQPIHNSYPFEPITTTKGTVGKRPLLVDMLRGSESGLTVSFLK